MVIPEEGLLQLKHHFLSIYFSSLLSSSLLENSDKINELELRTNCP